MPRDGRCGGTPWICSSVLPPNARSPSRCPRRRPRKSAAARSSSRLCGQPAKKVMKLFTAKALKDFLVAKKMPGVTTSTKPDKARMVERALQLYRESRMGDGVGQQEGGGGEDEDDDEGEGEDEDVAVEEKKRAPKAPKKKRS
eukprot:EC838146.1.p3 GENE.EC838146.1~~EC838146.1.p3  ORF type:complete len:143 (-),score=12.15 EC838146.1:118-546(-)